MDPVVMHEEGIVFYHVRFRNKNTESGYFEVDRPAVELAMRFAPSITVGCMWAVQETFRQLPHVAQRLSFVPDEFVGFGLNINLLPGFYGDAKDLAHPTLLGDIPRLHVHAGVDDRPMTRVDNLGTMIDDHFAIGDHWAIQQEINLFNNTKRSFGISINYN